MGEELQVAGAKEPFSRMRNSLKSAVLPELTFTVGGHVIQ